jgi:hypothetical protein
MEYGVFVLDKGVCPSTEGEAFFLLNRLLKNVHLRRYPHSSSLRRTAMYVSLFGISGALHLVVFEQPGSGCFHQPAESSGCVQFGK